MHTKLTLPPANTVWFGEISIIVGATGEKETEREGGERHRRRQTANKQGDKTVKKIETTQKVAVLKFVALNDTPATNHKLQGRPRKSPYQILLLR